MFVETNRNNKTNIYIYIYRRYNSIKNTASRNNLIHRNNHYFTNMPRKGAAAGKKKPLKNKSKGRKEMTPEEKAFKAKQAADKKAAAAYLKGKKK